MAKDYGDYKNQRHHDGRKIADGLKQASDDGMFFGASPTERKGLRKTKDKKSLKLEDLDLNALDREKFGAEKKVGENLRLIDMAMGNEPTPPPKAAPKPAPPPPPKGRKPKRRRKGKSMMSSWSGFMARELALEADRPAEAAPDYKGEGVVVAAPRKLVDRLAWLGALVALGGAAAGWTGAAGSAITNWTAAEAALAKGASVGTAVLAAVATWEALATIGVFFTWFAIGGRVLRRSRGSLLVELVRSGIVGGLPTAVGAGFLFWATAIGGPFAAPPSVAQPLIDLLAPAESLGVPAWVLGAAPLALVCWFVALVARLRSPRLDA